MKKQEFTVQNLSKICNESLIMGILINGKKHGYQLALEIEEQSNGLFKFNHGTLYPILHKLEKENLINGTWKQEGPKRKRKYYTLSAKGRRHLQNRKDEWIKFYKTFMLILGENENESL